MIEPQDVKVICDSCGDGARVVGIDGGLGELVRGFRDEGWTFETVDLCPACATAHPTKPSDR